MSIASSSRSSLAGKSRILVIGCGGSGKSVLARRLGSILGLPCVHLDAHYHLPGWRDPETSAWEETVRQLVRQPEWVMDGTFATTLPPRLERAEAVVFLDFSRARCYRGIARRYARYRGRSRPDMAAGCVESLDFDFLRYVWTFPDKVRPLIARLLAELPAGKPVVTLRTRREVRDWTASLETGQERFPTLRPAARQGSIDGQETPFSQGEETSGIRKAFHISPIVGGPMKRKLTAEERLERLRLLAERHELDRLVQKTPSQLRRMAELDQVLEGSRTTRPVAAAAPRP